MANNFGCRLCSERQQGAAKDSRQACAIATGAHCQVAPGVSLLEPYQRSTTSCHAGFATVDSSLAIRLLRPLVPDRAALSWAPVGSGSSRCSQPRQASTARTKIGRHNCLWLWLRAPSVICASAVLTKTVSMSPLMPAAGGIACTGNFAGCTRCCQSEAQLLVGLLTCFSQTVSCDGKQQQVCQQQAAKLGPSAMRQTWAGAHLSAAQAVPLRLHAPLKQMCSGHLRLRVPF